MADSYVEYNGDGAETDFTITFNYLSQTVVLPPSTPAGIKVYVSDVQQTSGYTLTGSDIVFTTAPASGTNNVVIKRVTPRGHSDRLVDFTAGATLSESDLETSQLQNLYIAQEAWEQGSEDSVVTTSTTSIDAGSITATELAPDSVGSSELADAPDGVRLANMGDDSVGTAQIVDDSITFAKLKETDFVTGSFTAATDTFLRFDKDSGNIVNPLLPASQVKSADISDFHAAVKTNRLDQMAEPTAAVDLSLEKITNLATPVAATDAATKGYVDSANPTMKYATFTASAATEVYCAIAHVQRVPVQILTGTVPSTATFITSVSWHIDITNTAYVVASGSNDDVAVNAYLHFGAFDVSDTPADDNILMAHWASLQSTQASTAALAGTADWLSNSYSQKPDIIGNVVAIDNSTPTGHDASRVIPMFQAYDGSLTPSVTAYFYAVANNNVETDDKVTITHATTVTVTYITA